MSTQQGPLGLALLGYGLGGAAFHAPVIRAVPDLAIRAVVTSDPERQAAARSAFPEADIVPSAESLWEMAAGLDIAVLATPNRTHVPLGLAALDAGLHVVVDKPLAASAEDARRLLEAARRRDRVLTVYQNRRWDGDFLTLRRLVDAGELGDVHRLESRFEGWRPIPKPGWRQNPAPAAAGGLLYDLGAHLIDQAILLFGPVRDLYAELDRRRPDARVDDDTFVALTHESGVRSHLWMNKIAARRGPRFRVLGSAASWTKHGYDPQERRLRAGADAGEPGFGDDDETDWGVLHDDQSSRRTRTEPGAYTAFYAGLAAAIREGAPPPVDPADAVAVLELIEAARDRAGLP